MITEPFEERLRFTILIVGSRGDVQPFIALGLGFNFIFLFLDTGISNLK